MKADPAGANLGYPSFGRRHAMRACLAIAVFVLVLATLGVAAARADEVSPGATTSAEPTPTESAVAADPVDTQETPSDEPTAVPAVPTSEEPTGGVSGPVEAGTGGGEGGGTATPTAEESAGSEQTPVEEGTLAAAAAVVHDPRASIGDINCANMTVPVTLDNSRSTEAVVYEIFAGAIEGDPTFQETIPRAAGSIRIINVPVTEDTQFLVDVSELPGEDFLPNRTLSFALLAVDCTDDDAHDPQARIGSLDCAHLQLDITLDNSRSEDEATYLVTASSRAYEEPTYEQVFTVPSGDVQTIPVPVSEDSVVRAEVVDWDAPDEITGQLALELFRVDCTPGGGVGATIGEVDCTDLTVPVTLDNTSSGVDRTFLVYASDLNDGAGYVLDEGDFPVAAGAKDAGRVQVADHTRVAVVAADEEAYSETGDTIAHEIFDVDCVRVAAGRVGPQLAAGESALAATGANSLTLPFAGLAMLAAGGVLSLLGRRHT